MGGKDVRDNQGLWPSTCERVQSDLGRCRDTGELLWRKTGCLFGCVEHGVSVRCTSGVVSRSLDF